MSATAARAAPKAGRLDLGDQQLDYHWYEPSRPGRPSLVFLHEGLGCVGLWQDFPALLAQRTGCGALVYSRAGYGNSSQIALPRPLRYMHDEGQDVLPRVLEQLHLEQFFLIGHSDGASISLIFAGTPPTPPGLKGVVCLAPHVFNEESCVVGIEQTKARFLEGPLRTKLQKWHGDNVDCAFWGWNGAWLDPGFWYWNIEEFLPNILTPMLVIQGQEDEYGTARQWQAIRDQSGGPVELLILESCGHTPQRQQQQATAQAIVDFVEANI
ncbi:MAG TPA: alpha/beta hydrolase [Rhodospirillaceae bacterium]|nr:alpha/beta hydrolase [Rhodospirillaceae bacterium]